MASDMESTPKSRWLDLASAQRVREQLSDVARRHGLMAFFTLQVIGLVFLQKLAVQFDISLFGIYLSVGAIQATLLVFYIGLLGLISFANPKIDLTRLILFSILLITVIISVSVQRAIYSQASVLLMVACYLPFILVVEVNAVTYRRMLNVYLNVMIIIGVIVLLQQASQAIWSWTVWPNLDLLVPPKFLLPNFNYIQPITYGSLLMKPSAVFFLEVSTVSQFLAVAFAIEMIYFRRVHRLAFSVVALLATFAGTGPMLLAMCVPVLLLKLSWRSFLVVLVIFAAGYIAAEQLHWYQQVQGRLDEYESQGSSAYLRFVDPFLDILEALRRPDSVLAGIGPGNTMKFGGVVSWAVTKVTVEYGVLTLLSFSALVGYTLFKGAPSLRMAFMLIVFFNFMGGGIVIPIYPVMIFIFGGLFRVTAPTQAQAARGLGDLEAKAWMLGSKRIFGARSARAGSRAKAAGG